MKLFYDKRSKDPIYYIQMGIRNGKKTTTKNVCRIGKHSELLSITSDPLAYAKEQVAKYNNDFAQSKIDMSVSIDFNAKVSNPGDVVSQSTQVNIGYFILQRIYHDLKLHDFFIDITKNRKMTFDCNEINRFLTFARVLEPDSKLGTYDHLHNYFEKPQFQYQHILRFMDVLAENYDSYLQHLFDFSNLIVPRDTSVCYLDFSNYYFEIEDEDDDYFDEVTGELIKGFRKYGPSKEHRPNPIVQMGLFMDSSGIPISMCLNSGSDNEQKCAIPLEKKLTKMLKNKKIIYCADAGLGSLNIRKFNSMGGRAFIVTQSVKKLSDTLKEAVFNDFEYKLLSNDKSVTLETMKSFDRFDENNLSLYQDSAYKVLDVDSVVDLGLFEEKQLKNGKIKMIKSKANVKQRIIITFSRKMMEYQRHIRNAQIERAKKLLNSQKLDSIKKGPHDVTRFIKRTSKAKNGDTDIVDSYEIDSDVINREEMYDGFYAIATNLDDHPREIIEISSKRYKIEDCFRILKSYFGGRPVGHRLENRITAHFMICYTALLIYRLLEVQLDKKVAHYTIENIIETIKNMNVVNCQDLYYQSLYEGSEICSAFNQLYNLELDRKYYLPKDLNKKIRNLLK